VQRTQRTQRTYCLRYFSPLLIGEFRSTLNQRALLRFKLPSEGISSLERDATVSWVRHCVTRSRRVWLV
jgi:hypothetical protein